MPLDKKRELLRKYAIVFWILLGFFVLRVFGQILVEFFNVSFLPPSKFWMSAYVSQILGDYHYPVLLVAQIFAIGLLLKVCVDFTRGHGYFTEKSKWKRMILYAGIVYFVSMAVVRPIIEGGISIPSVFHGVLATFAIIAGIYYRR